MSAVLLDMEGGMGKVGDSLAGTTVPRDGRREDGQACSRPGERAAERDRKKTKGQVLQEAGREEL